MDRGSRRVRASHGRDMPFHALPAAARLPLLLVAIAVASCGRSQNVGYLGSAGGDDGGDPAMASADGDSGTGSTGSPAPVLGSDASVIAPSGPTGTGCLPGLTCNVSCPGGGTTSITGKVYDPAGNNPLYNVAVYVPATPLTPLPKGVPTGAAACSCDALFPSGAITNTTTAVDGTFTLSDVPVGSNVPLVIQLGKWRRQVMVAVAACKENAQPDKSLAFLGTIPDGDTNDNMPDIAVSTGACDTLECLLFRVGIPATEYVAGASTSQHIHIFSGGQGGNSSENPPMAGAPNSSASLWDTQAHMMPYDIVLLSCECGETIQANPPVLEQYLNAGGRAFGSHFHYVWFGGSKFGNAITAPSDWGSNLAAWFPSGSTLPPIDGNPATVVQTLTGTSTPFPKGVVVDQWLGIVDALGVEGAPAGEIPIFDQNRDVGATHEAQAWLTDDDYTDYLSFDTPVNAPAPPDGGPPAYCGRGVFSALHLNSDPNSVASHDTNPPPTGCQTGPLSPQEKALEFMLFDLSSCVLPDTVPPPVDAGFPPPPPK